MRCTIAASLQMSDGPFFCVFATYCSFCFQICIIPVLWGGFTRAYMRASGVFCFLPSLLHPYALSCWVRERKGWRSLLFCLHTLFTHYGDTVKVRRALAFTRKWLKSCALWLGGEGWRQKAKIRWVRTRAWAERKLHPQCSCAASKAGAFLDLAGEKRAKVGRCFRFPSSSFEFQSIGDLVVWDVERNRRARWEWVCTLVHGARAQRVRRGEEKTQRATPLWSVARCLFAVRSFLCFLSTPERKPPCFLLSYENLWDLPQISVFNRL